MGEKMIDTLDQFDLNELSRTKDFDFGNEVKHTYVAGFLFATDKWGQLVVALIEKQKPEWQRNRLNAIGGKIELGESPQNAMMREFREETGFAAGVWRPFALLHHLEAMVVFYEAQVRTAPVLTSPTVEKVAWFPVSRVTAFPTALPILSNLAWLIPLALSPARECVVIRDQSPIGTHR